MALLPASRTRHLHKNINPNYNTSCNAPSHLHHHEANRRVFSFKWSKCIAALILYGVPLTLLLNMRKLSQSVSSSYSSNAFSSVISTDRYLGAQQQDNAYKLYAAHQGGKLSLHENSIVKHLRPGDLPGYTGWARPAFTLAGWFQTQQAPGHASVGRPWVATVACHHVLCQSGGALFDVRAYGPAVLPGIVEDLGNGTYELSLQFFDEGLYTVEWVLAFSKPPPFASYPRSVEVYYEGYLLPGFPLTVQVTTALSSDSWYGSFIDTLSQGWPSSVLSEPVEQEDYDEDQNESSNPYQSQQDSNSAVTCAMSDVIQDEFTSPVQQGRWLVEERVLDPTLTAGITSMSAITTTLNNTTGQNQDGDDKDQVAMLDVTLEGYQRGHNSIGFRMGFHRPDCNLPTLEEMRTRMESRPRHVIFIGDSNMGRQEKVFSEMKYAQVTTKIFMVNGGLQNTLSTVQQKLLDLAARARNESETTQYYIYFNAGLHEIAQMCRLGPVALFSRQNKINADTLGPCTERYQHYLTALIQAVLAFPAELVVFQTSVSAWSKWGNYGFGWPTMSGQSLPLANQYVEYFNRIAWDIVQDHRIPIVDGYWRSVSRPDHREVSEANEIGKHLVHLGPELYDLFMREWALLLVESDLHDPSPAADLPPAAGSIDNTENDNKKDDSMETDEDQEDGKATISRRSAHGRKGLQRDKKQEETSRSTSRRRTSERQTKRNGLR